MKDLKALAGLAVFFADDRLLRRVLRRLTRQLAMQVLPDGGHYERAPAYHCQVLADLIDMRPARGRRALAAARDHHGDRSDAPLAGRVFTPDGEVPLLNDGYPVGAPL